MDRDNNGDNPPASKSFAVRSPLGKVVTNELKNSITRETVDKTSVSFGIGITVTDVTTSGTIPTITFARNHGISGMVEGSFTPGNGYSVSDLSLIHI